MSSDYTFEGETIERLHRRAVDAWQEQVPEETPQGWSSSPVDFAPFLAAFPGLRLKPGFVLRAYQYRERNDAEGVVWALPDDAPLPDPAGLPEDDEAAPPRPPGALDDLMEAIEGDGSPWSYLSASLFAREAAEFGAFGHGRRWQTHRVLAADPSADGAPPSPAGAPGEWEWLEPQPSAWAPTVRLDGETVTVRFYTLSALGGRTITRHVDRYRRGDYRFTTDEQVIARAPGGYLP